jgi:hypothetical protein
MPQTPEYTVRLRTPHEHQREKVTPEPLTSAKASVLLGKNDTGRKPGHPEGYPHPSTPRRLPIYPYTSLMAEEDTVLEEAMDNLKEAGQRIRATQSLLRSQGKLDDADYRELALRLSTSLAKVEAAYMEARRRG